MLQKASFPPPNKGTSLWVPMALRSLQHCWDILPNPDPCPWSNLQQYHCLSTALGIAALGPLNGLRTTALVNAVTVLKKSLCFVVGSHTSNYVVGSKLYNFPALLISCPAKRTFGNFPFLKAAFQYLLYKLEMAQSSIWGTDWFAISVNEFHVQYFLFWNYASTQEGAVVFHLWALGVLSLFLWGYPDFTFPLGLPCIQSPKHSGIPRIVICSGMKGELDFLNP